MLPVDYGMSLDCFINELVNRLNDATGSGWIGLVIDKLYHYEDEEPTWGIVGLRWETNAELKARIKATSKQQERRKKAQQLKEERDRKLYEKLKQKFEK
jgi:hypothetical protein